MAKALLDANGIKRLRAALEAAEYTTEGILWRFGSSVAASLFQYDTATMLRATADLGQLSTLIRVLWFGQAVRADRVAEALRPLKLAEAVASGLLREDDAGLRAEVQIAPCREWWLACDFPAAVNRGPLATDHVGGTDTLSSAISGANVGDALDLGCGAGVQSLHLSAHAGQVTATDLSHRALRFAATTNALNGFDWELKHGDLAGPVAGRRFDLVVSANRYRDWGRPGDGSGAELAALAPDLLTEGGLMQFSATWAHVTGQPWEERVSAWLSGTGCDAWVLQTSVADPLSYLDSFQDQARKAAWADWFQLHRISAVGSGVISLRYTGHENPSLVCETLYQRTDSPLGQHVRQWFSRNDWLRIRRSELMSHRFAASGGLRLRQDATLTAPGQWQISRQILAQPEGLRWAQEVSPVVAAAVSACDGKVPLNDQVAKAAIANDADPAIVVASVASLLPQLILRGFLIPVDL